MQAAQLKRQIKRQANPQSNSADQMKEHILNVATGLFYREGLRAVGIDRIIAEAGIAKATLYRHFATKEQLIADYLRSRHVLTLQAI